MKKNANRGADAGPREVRVDILSDITTHQGRKRSWSGAGPTEAQANALYHTYHQQRHDVR